MIHRSLLFIDIETTGLNCPPAVMLSIGTSLVTADGEVIDTEFLIRPTEQEWALADEGALRVNGFTLEQAQQGLPLEIVKGKFAEWLYDNKINQKSTQHIGMNAQFDLKFLDCYLGDVLDWYDYPRKEYADVMMLAKSLRNVDSTFTPTSLSGKNISIGLGIQAEDDLHTAMGGVEAVKRNYYELNRRLMLPRSKA